MFKTAAVTVSAVAFVMLAIALGPNVPAALAAARAIITNTDKLNQPTVQPTCTVLEVWFLDPSCRHKRAKKSAQTKHPGDAWN
jgi:hypothetical protein